MTEANLQRPSEALDPYTTLADTFAEAIDCAIETYNKRGPLHIDFIEDGASLLRDPKQALFFRLLMLYPDFEKVSYEALKGQKSTQFHLRRHYRFKESLSQLIDNAPKDNEWQIEMLVLIFRDFLKEIDRAPESTNIEFSLIEALHHQISGSWHEVNMRRFLDTIGIKPLMSSKDEDMRGVDMTIPLDSEQQRWASLDIKSSCGGVKAVIDQQPAKLRPPITVINGTKRMYELNGSTPPVGSAKSPVICVCPYNGVHLVSLDTGIVGEPNYITPIDFSSDNHNVVRSAKGLLRYLRENPTAERQYHDDRSAQTRWQSTLGSLALEGVDY